MNVHDWVKPVGKLRSRILPVPVDIETCCVHSPSPTLETNAATYLREENGDQQSPGALKSPAIILGPGRTSAALRASNSG